MTELDVCRDELVAVGDMYDIAVAICTQWTQDGVHQGPHRGMSLHERQVQVTWERDSDD